MKVDNHLHIICSTNSNEQAVSLVRDKCHTLVLGEEADNRSPVKTLLCIYSY